MCALRFLYRVTLGRPELIEHIPYPKQEKKLPVVFSREELARFFDAIASLKHRTILMTMYAAGPAGFRRPSGNAVRCTCSGTC